MSPSNAPSLLGGAPATVAEALPLATGAAPVLAAAQRVASKEASLLPSSGHVLPVGGATIVKHTQAVNFGRGLGAVAYITAVTAGVRQ